MDKNETSEPPELYVGITHNLKKSNRDKKKRPISRLGA